MERYEASAKHLGKEEPRRIKQSDGTTPGVVSPLTKLRTLKAYDIDPISGCVKAKQTLANSLVNPFGDKMEIKLQK